MRNHSVAQYKELLEGDCLSQITLKSLGCLLHISSSCKVHGMLEQMTATTSHPTTRVIIFNLKQLQIKYLVI